MNKIYLVLFIGLLILGCKAKTENQNINQKKVELNKELVEELESMVEIDQIAASNAFPPEKYSYLTQLKWESFKDSIYQKNQKRTKEILDKYGFAGYNLVGKKGSKNFWLIVQHSDHNPEFQKQVLKKMKVEVDKKNADPSNYALLVDRVKLNTGEKQVYGTQVDFNHKVAQAFPKNLADSLGVNERRKSVGLKPIEEYLNEMSKMHFEMNKARYEELGITGPKLYKKE